MNCWKRICILTTVTLASTFAGTIARISDPDGFVNIRVAPVRGADIFQTAENGECVEFFARGPEWTHVAYTKDNEVITGYIKSSRLHRDAHCKIPNIETRFGACALGTILAAEFENFTDLKDWQSKYGQCKETEPQEQASDFTAAYLAGHSKQAFAELQSMTADKGFLETILARLSQASSGKDLQAVSSLLCDASNAKPLCERVKATAAKAIKR